MLKRGSLFSTVFLIAFAFEMAGVSVFHGQANALAEDGNENAAPVCMVKVHESDRVLPIILPATDVGAMKAVGFAPISCGEYFGTAEQSEAWKQEICAMASTYDEDVHASHEVLWGVRPNVLCGMAEIASSRWNRGAGQ